MRQLQIVAELLKASKGVLQISGHTDYVGSEKYNLELSIRRANAVKEALVSFGVEDKQISTEGMGKSQPRRFYTTEDTTEQIDYIRGENRRAEIYLDFES
jgi:outer membrane protein OmpA-like peptidoglycan-associated protein